MKVLRSYRHQLPSRPMPRDVFARHVAMFMDRIPEEATVEIDAHVEKGDPPYLPDVKRVALVADWTDEVEG